MLLTPHLLTGAAIASNIHSAPLVLASALVSHYLLDLFPHQEYSIKNIKEGRWRQSFFEWLKVSLDFTLGAALILLFSKNIPLIFAAAFLAIVPDGFTLLAILFPKNKLLSQHQRLHQRVSKLGENKKIPALWGILSQIAVAVTAISLL